ncbi:MAG: methyl-accepting chemotaxis protein [Rubrivivax sp.]
MFSKLSIRSRLFAAFGVILLLLAAVAAAGAYGLLSARAGLQALTGQVQPLQTRSENAIRAALRARVAEQTMVANNLDNSAIDEQKKAWDAALKASLQAVAELQQQADLSAVKPGLDAVAVATEAYRKAYEVFHKDLVAARFPDTKEAAAAMGDVNKAFADVEAAYTAHSRTVDQMASGIEAGVAGVVASVTGVLGVVALVAVALGVVVALQVSASIARPLADAQAQARRIASGDLTQDIHAPGQDEAAQTLQALQKMTTSLRSIVGEVRASVDSIQTASTEVATGNLDLSQRTEMAAANLQNAAGTLDQLTSTVQHSAASAHTANQLASSASEVAQRGGAVVAQVVATMVDIDASSKKIADIIGTIDGIAFQTNILALNAAVEAARAGEQGRGFAVVASEVRSLAQRSADAAREIKALIGNSVAKVEAGSRLVQDAGSTMDDIVASVRRVCDTIGEVTAASSEQSQNIGQVNDSVNQLDQVTQQNAALVEQSAAAADSLKEQAARLAQAVSSFRLH